MRYQFGGVGQIRTNLILWNPYIILYFPVPHNTLCLHKPLFLNAPGSIAFSQEHFKTISYAKFGGRQSVLWGIGR